MNAVTAKQEHQALAVVGESAALIDVISRAAKDPAVDINKLEKLMEMHERITARDSEKAFNAAMTACQAEMKQVSADAENPQTRSKYASYAKLDKVLRPIYTSHGFSLSFDEGDSPKPEHVRVLCYVAHNSGHTRIYRRDMPADGKGAKGGDVMTKTHAAGAAGSYGSRYLLKGIFNVAVGDEDNDGNGPRGARMDEKKLADHLAAIDTADADRLFQTFKKPFQEAEKLGDKQAMRLLTQHKDARKKALGMQS